MLGGLRRLTPSPSAIVLSAGPIVQVLVEDLLDVTKGRTRRDSHIAWRAVLHHSAMWT